MTSKVIYKGQLSTKATHLFSGSEIQTDAPIDNQGTGANFSPTDLTATSLASCMLTIIGITSGTHGFSIEGTEAEVTKKMGTDPRRIIEIEVIMHMKGQDNYTEKEKTIIENAARNCPVAKSLHPDIFQNITFIWP